MDIFATTKVYRRVNSGSCWRSGLHPCSSYWDGVQPLSLPWQWKNKWTC